MDKTSSTAPAKGFASCTRGYYEKMLNSGKLPCLLEYPEVGAWMQFSLKLKDFHKFSKI